jgi:hypothetical protein
VLSESMAGGEYEGGQVGGDRVRSDARRREENGDVGVGGRRAGPPRRARLLPFTAGASAKGQAGEAEAEAGLRQRVRKKVCIVGTAHLYND